MSRDLTNHERIVDDLAVALCELPDLDNETACIQYLMGEGWRAAVIAKHLTEALGLARMVRADWQSGVRVKHHG